MKLKRCIVRSLLLAAALELTLTAQAQLSLTVTNVTGDAFLAASHAGLNYGSAGTLALAPSTSPKGEFDSVLRFNFGSTISQLNNQYGVGAWQITGLTLRLASNFGTNGAVPNNNLFPTINGGLFGIDWLATDSWVEGAGGGNGTAGFPNNSFVDFNSIPGLLSGGFSSLGTYTYNPPGNNVYTNYSLTLDSSLLADATAGGDVSFYFFAADSQIAFLFNSIQGNNAPQLIVTAIPEPGTVALAATGSALWFWKRRKFKK